MRLKKLKWEESYEMEWSYRFYVAHSSSIH